MEREPGRHARSFANGVIVFAVVACVFLVVQRNRTPGMRIVPAAIALGLLGASRLRLDRRLSLALTLLPCMIVLYVGEYLIERRLKPAAARVGAAFDTRSVPEVVHDLRAEGKEPYPSLPPLVLSSQAGLPRIDGAPTLPLGSIANALTVFCNEGGRYSIYESDERGFNNPRGLWTTDRADVAVVGDSYTQGACVAPDETLAAVIRRRYPQTLSLGMSNNGPLMELAGIRELLTGRRPRIVLWFYCNNDLDDLNQEKKIDILLRYLEDDDYRQGIEAKQGRIDAELKGFFAARSATLQSGWPTTLSTIGLTRARAPLVLQDLITGVPRTFPGSILRLERVSNIVSRLGDKAREPSDFALFQRVLATAKRAVSSWGGELYFVGLPSVEVLFTKGTVQDRPRVLALAREAGLPVIDLDSTFAALEPETVLFHWASHCNAEGYRIIAEAVLREIEPR